MSLKVDGLFLFVCSKMAKIYFCTIYSTFDIRYCFFDRFDWFRKMMLMMIVQRWHSLLRAHVCLCGTGKRDGKQKKEIISSLLFFFCLSRRELVVFFFLWQHLKSERKQKQGNLLKYQSNFAQFVEKNQQWISTSWLWTRFLDIFLIYAHTKRDFFGFFSLLIAV